jgi:hypothetical protein
VNYRRLYVLDPVRAFDALYRYLSLPSGPVGNGQCAHSTRRHASSDRCSQCIGIEVSRLAPSQRDQLREGLGLTYQSALGAALAAGLR